MANGWQEAQGFVALGHLVGPHSDEPAHAVIEPELEIASPSLQSLSNIPGIPRHDAVPHLCQVAGRAYEPEQPNLIPDAASVPRVDLVVTIHHVHISATYPQHLWRMSSLTWNVLQPELELPSGLRRIWWNSKLLTQRQCKLAHTPMEAPAIGTCTEKPADPDLAPEAEVEPKLASVERLAAEFLPSEAAVRFGELRATPEGCEPPRLIGPRVKVEFDLRPLRSRL